MTVSEKSNTALEIDGVAILPPMDVFESIAVLKDANIDLDCTMLDPCIIKGMVENCLQMSMMTS